MSVVPNGNGHNGNTHVDARRLVVPLWHSVTTTTAIVGLVAGLIGLYYFTITDISGQIRETNNTIKDIAKSVELAMKKSDFEIFCLRAQIVNKGWICPGANAEEAQADPKLSRVTQTPEVTPRKPRKACEKTFWGGITGSNC